MSEERASYDGHPAMTAAEFDRAFLWRFRARFERLVDADTVAVLADTGFGGRHEAHIRLAGVSAAELNTPAGKAADEWLSELMGWHEIEGGDLAWPLRVVSLQRKTKVAEVKSIERYVGTIAMVERDGTLTDVGNALVAAGHAIRVPA